MAVPMVPVSILVLIAAVSAAGWSTDLVRTLAISLAIILVMGAILMLVNQFLWRRIWLPYLSSFKDEETSIQD